MPILLGVLASLTIGISDSLGRAGTRRSHEVTHVSTQMLYGAFTTLLIVVVLDSQFILRDAISGAFSGLAIAGGLATMYRGMAGSSAAIVSPTAGVASALLPLIWDLLTGASLAAITAVGCVVALLSLVLTTFNPNFGGNIRSSLAMALVGGSLLGIAVITAADTSDASGAWPAFTQRTVGFVLLATIALRRGVPVLQGAGVRRFGIAGGIAGGLGMAFWVIGSQQGELGTVSIVASTYPAFVAIFATLFDDDEIRWWQAIGIGGAILGTALIAFGST